MYVAVKAPRDGLSEDRHLAMGGPSPKSWVASRPPWTSDLDALETATEPRLDHVLQSWPRSATCETSPENRWNIP
jgi:hypothetical protein